MTERLDYKRAGLALIAVAALVMAMLAITAGTPAFADHVDPDDTYESSPGDGSNEGDFWDDYFGLPDGSCVKINSQSGSAFEMPDPPDGKVWYALVVKQGSPSSNDGPDNFIYLNPEAGHDYPSAGSQAPGHSHVIVCSVVEQVTTTTVAETTTTEAETTTTEGETTTTEAETTTTEGETTTTEAEETTTTVEVEQTTLVGETTTSSIQDTVLGTEVLPFTGVESEWTFWLAVLLALTGGLLVYGAKRVEE